MPQSVRENSLTKKWTATKILVTATTHGVLKVSTMEEVLTRTRLAILKVVCVATRFHKVLILVGCYEEVVATRSRSANLLISFVKKISGKDIFLQNGLQRSAAHPCAYNKGLSSAFKESECKIMCLVIVARHIRI